MIVADNKDAPTTYQYKSLKKKKKPGILKKVLNDRDELYKGLQKMLGRGKGKSRKK